MTEVSHKGTHDYNLEYTQGAHWEKDNKPSSNMPRFMRYLRGGETILDAGCGSGRDPIYLAGQGFNVIGIDQSQVAIRKATEKVTNNINVRFHVGKIEELPYTDSTFDAAYSGYTLGGKALPKQISEIARVLKPKGIFYLAMFISTKYQKPTERDEENPEKWIMKNILPFFKVVDKEKDSYQEPDDIGTHTHHRLRLALKKIL